MLRLKKMPNEGYRLDLSNLTTELFDLVIATANILESQSISATSLLDKALAEERTAQDILSIILTELEELEGRGMLIWEDPEELQANMIFEMPIDC